MLNTIQNKKVATIGEIAEMFNLAKHFVRQLVLQKKVKFLRAGAKYLVNIESIAKYLDECPTDEIQGGLPE